MTERKNLKIQTDTYQMLLKHKRDGETWDRLMWRLANQDWTEADG